MKTTPRMKIRKRRCTWIRVDGTRVRFELNRKAGLWVRRHGKRQIAVSFPRLYDTAVKQPQLPMT